MANAGSKQLLFFDRDGRFLESVGRQGDGPGEFQAMFGFFRCGADTLVVEEVTRMSLVSVGGRRVARSVPIVGHFSQGRLGLQGLAPDCSRALFAKTQFVSPDRNAGLHTVSAHLFWGDMETGAHDTIAMLPVLDAVPGELVGGRQPMIASMGSPFGRRAMWAPYQGGVVVGLALRNEYEVFGNDGVEAVVRWDAALEPSVTPSGTRPSVPKPSTTEASRTNRG